MTHRHSHPNPPSPLGLAGAILAWLLTLAAAYYIARFLQPLLPELPP